jgi:hypothetical protein
MMGSSSGRTIMNLHQDILPAWVNSLRCLHAILGKAEQFAIDREVEPAVMLSLRLFPDMFPLSRQVQIACDLVARATARLCARPLPEFPDEETTLAELRDRISTVVEHCESVTEQDLSATQGQMLDIPMGRDSTQSMSVEQYVCRFVTPNLYFHLTTTYNLLRSNGVELGKRDFLMP